jgi:death-on-curing protein
LNVAAYGAPDVSDLAASYCIGLAKNHPFVDGNKRAAFLAVGMFLYLNGYRLQATQAEATLTILSVADGSLAEPEFADWLRTHIVARTH